MNRRMVAIEFNACENKALKRLVRYTENIKNKY